MSEKKEERRSYLVKLFDALIDDKWIDQWTVTTNADADLGSVRFGRVVEPIEDVILTPAEALVAVLRAHFRQRLIFFECRCSQYDLIDGF